MIKIRAFEFAHNFERRGSMDPPHARDVSVAELVREVWLALRDTRAYVRAICYLLGGGRYDPRAPALRGLAAPSRVHCLGRALHAAMWQLPHYRCDSWREDMRKNLRNVALPGTGVPLSVLCVSKAAVTAFVVAGVPAYALAAGLCEVLRPPCATGCRGRLLAALQLYRKHLLAPSDWCTFTRTRTRTSGSTHTHPHTPTRPHALTPTHLQTCARAWRRSQKLAPFCKPTYLDRARRFSIWRLNCALAALHAHVTADAGYALEDKWTFLHKAREAGIAVSPWWDASSQVFGSTLSHILAIFLSVLFSL
jgi:hypothetical protein